MTFWDHIKNLAVEVKDVILAFLSAIPWWELFMKILEMVIEKQDLILAGEIDGEEARESTVTEFVDTYKGQIGAVGEPDLVSKYENRVRRLLETAVWLMWTLGSDRVVEIAESFRVDVESPSRPAWVNKYDPMSWYVSRPDRK